MRVAEHCHRPCRRFVIILVDNIILSALTYTLYVGLIVADDNQVIKWANLMISECWHVLIKLGKDSDNLFKCQQVLHHVLSIFSALIGKELLNEVMIRYSDTEYNNECFTIFMQLY